jgi:hypothetical protein
MTKGHEFIRGAGKSFGNVVAVGHQNAACVCIDLNSNKGLLFSDVVCS